MLCHRRHKTGDRTINTALWAAEFRADHRNCFTYAPPSEKIEKVYLPHPNRLALHEFRESPSGDGRIYLPDLSTINNE